MNFNTLDELEGLEIQQHEAGERSVLKMLDSSEFSSTFASEDSRQVFLHNLTPESLEGFLIKLNAASRGINPEQHAFDGENVKIQTTGMVMSNPDEHIPPRHKDKSEILGFVLDRAKEGNLHDAGFALGFAVNACHPFADGNGRTSRLVYSLLADGYDGSEGSKERIKEIMDSKAGRNLIDLQLDDKTSDAAEFYATQRIFRVNPYQKTSPHFIDSNEVEFVGEWELENIKSKGDLSPDTRMQMKSLLNEMNTITNAFAIFMHKHPELVIDGTTIARREKDGELMRTDLLIDKLMPMLEEKDYKEILDIAFTIKKVSIELMATEILEPTGSQAKQVGAMSLRSYFVGNSNNLVSTKVYPRYETAIDESGKHERVLAGYQPRNKRNT